MISEKPTDKANAFRAALEKADGELPEAPFADQLFIGFVYAIADSSPALSAEALAELRELAIAHQEHEYKRKAAEVDEEYARFWAKTTTGFMAEVGGVESETKTEGEGE